MIDYRKEADDYFDSAQVAFDAILDAHEKGEVPFDDEVLAQYSLDERKKLTPHGFAVLKIKVVRENQNKGLQAMRRAEKENESS